MNGSRVNPAAPRDPLQDFDVVYVVTETASFLADPRWIDRFGERLICQEPDELDRRAGRAADFSASYCYLMQFTDGSRIDLHLQTLAQTLTDYGSDSLTRCLLDKDGCLPPLPEPDDRGYRVALPTADGFFACCNIFWWVYLYVAKGLWRGELSYAAQQRDDWVRPELLKLLGWLAAAKAKTPICAGKAGKYLPRYLPEPWWDRYLSTYAPGAEDPMWDALENMGTCFLDASQALAAALGLPLDVLEARAVLAYAARVRVLPRDAAAIT